MMLRYRLFLAAATLSVAAAGCSSSDPIRRGENFSCSGPFSRYTSAETLATYYGTANVIDGVIDVGEGETENGTVLFPDSAGKRMEITWKDPVRKRDLASIRLREASGGWSAFPGVMIGMTLPEVEMLNRGPFTIYGFAWDYGGTVADWNGGFLAQPSGEGCRLIVRFGLPSDHPELGGRFQGETRIESTDPDLRRLEPIVEEIILVMES